MTANVYGAFALAKRFTFLISLSFAANALAVANDVKTTYDISGAYSKTRTEFKKAPLDLDARFKDKLWETFRNKLKAMPMVSDIQVGEAKETKDDLGNYFGYVTVKRSFPAFIQLNVPAPVTMLVSVEESRRVCKNPSQTTSGTISDCTLNSTLDIKGPISVYGNYDTPARLDVPANAVESMRDQQRINITVSRSYDAADLTIDSTFYVDSMLFEKSLLAFTKQFNVKAISQKSEDLTRQNIFLGIARVVRQNNERMLEL